MQTTIFQNGKELNRDEYIRHYRKLIKNYDVVLGRWKFVYSKGRTYTEILDDDAQFYMLRAAINGLRARILYTHIKHTQ